MTYWLNNRAKLQFYKMITEKIMQFESQLYIWIIILAVIFFTFFLLKKLLAIFKLRIENSTSAANNADIVKKIENLISQYQQDNQAKDEQIKSLTAAVTALSQGKDSLYSESQINEAIVALAQGHIDKAKELFVKETQRIAAATKQVAEAYRNLGELTYHTDTQEALEAYHHAIQLDEDNADSWNQLGKLLHRVGKIDEAIAAYQKAVALGESHQDQEEIAAAYSNLGIVCQMCGEIDKAIGFHEKALKAERRVRQ